MLEHVTRKQGPRRGHTCLPNSRSLQRTWLKNLGFSIYMNSLWPNPEKNTKNDSKMQLVDEDFSKTKRDWIRTTISKIFFYHKYQYFKNWINSVIRKKPKLFFKKRFCVVFHSTKKWKVESARTQPPVCPLVKTAVALTQWYFRSCCYVMSTLIRNGT